MSSEFQDLPQQSLPPYDPALAPLPSTTVPIPEVLPADTPPTRPHPGFLWSILWCVGFIICTQVPGAILLVVVMMALQIVKLSAEGGNLANKLVAMLSDENLLQSDEFRIAALPAFFFTEFLVISVSWAVIRLVMGKDWPRQLALRRPSLAHLILVLMGLPAMVLLGNGTYELAKELLPVLKRSTTSLVKDIKNKTLVTRDNKEGKSATEDNKEETPAEEDNKEEKSTMEEMARVFQSWPWPLGVLIIGMGPGIGEELWCRGFLGRGLVGRYGFIVGILLTSFFFGLIHLDFAQGLATVVMGICLHFAYVTTRSFLMPMLLHFLNNSLAVVASRIAVLRELDALPQEVQPHVYIAASVLLLAVGWALYRSRARLMHKDGPSLPHWEPDFPSVAYPPPNSDTVVFRPRIALFDVILVACTFLFLVALLGLIGNFNRQGI